MESDDFFDVFYSNLMEELDDEEIVNNIQSLINDNKLKKNSFLELLKGENDE